MRIQEGHFLKIALNLVLILENESTWNSLKIVDLQNETNILVTNQCFFRILVPMSYISFWEHARLSRLARLSKKLGIPPPAQITATVILFFF